MDLGPFGGVEELVVISGDKGRPAEKGNNWRKNYFY
jgi:hypothetical protein